MLDFDDFFFFFEALGVFEFELYEEFMSVFVIFDRSFSLLIIVPILLGLWIVRECKRGCEEFSGSKQRYEDGSENTY